MASLRFSFRTFIFLSSLFLSLHRIYGGASFICQKNAFLHMEIFYTLISTFVLATQKLSSTLLGSCGGLVISGFFVPFQNRIKMGRLLSPMGAVFSLLLIVLISIVITKIATVALIHTGLSKETAQFQARSALTGVGFTTHESERLVNDPVRRRILMILMIVGNAGIVTAMASLILTYVKTGEDVSIWWKTLVIVLGVGTLWFVAVSRTVNRSLAWLISKLLKKYTKLSVHDFTSLLHLAKDYRVDEFLVEESDWVANENLQNLELAEEGLLVLGIERTSGEYVGTPGGQTKISAGDKLIIYGRAQNIVDLDNRRKGRSGDKSHFQSVRVQKHVEKVQKDTPQESD